MLLSCRCDSVDGKRKTASVSLTCESEMRLAHATLDAGSGDDDEDQVCCVSLDLRVVMTCSTLYDTFS